MEKIVHSNVETMSMALLVVKRVIVLLINDVTMLSDAQQVFWVFWELNEVQSPYVVGLNKRNDFCEN